MCAGGVAVRLAETRSHSSLTLAEPFPQSARSLPTTTSARLRRRRGRRRRDPVYRKSLLMRPARRCRSLEARFFSLCACGTGARYGELLRKRPEQLAGAKECTGKGEGEKCEEDDESGSVPQLTFLPLRFLQRGVIGRCRVSSSRFLLSLCVVLAPLIDAAVKALRNHFARGQRRMLSKHSRSGEVP